MRIAEGHVILGNREGSEVSALHLQSVRRQGDAERSKQDVAGLPLRCPTRGPPGQRPLNQLPRHLQGLDRQAAGHAERQPAPPQQSNTPHLTTFAILCYRSYAKDLSMSSVEPAPALKGTIKLAQHVAELCKVAVY